MALYTDGLTTNISDLRTYDSSVLEVASMENIDAAAKLQLAQTELGIEVSNFLLRHGFPQGPNGVLANVVVTQQMLHVHCLHALALLYRDAYNSQLNERHKSKWREFVKEADLALRRLFETGIGIAVTPVPQAPMPVLSYIAGGYLPARTYSVAAVFTGIAGVAGAASAAVTIELPPATLLSVALPVIPDGAQGFIVNAGETEQAMHRQSVSPTASIQAWIEPVQGLRQDLAPWPPQRADYYVANRRQILRG
jgi:hypothetical protein